jgi:hypothetical protein
MWLRADAIVQASERHSLRHDGRIVHRKKKSENRVVAVACPSFERNARAQKWRSFMKRVIGNVQWDKCQHSCRYFRTAAKVRTFWFAGHGIRLINRIYPSDDCIIIYIFQSRKHTCRDILLTSFWGIFFQYPFFWLQYNITNKANEFIPFSCWSFSLIGYYDDVCSLSFGSLNNRLFKCLKSTLILEYTKKIWKIVWLLLLVPLSNEMRA